MKTTSFVLFGALVLWAACGLRAARPGAPDALSSAPNFSLPDDDKNEVTLDDVTADGYAVLVFYRAHW